VNVFPGIEGTTIGVGAMIAIIDYLISFYKFSTTIYSPIEGSGNGGIGIRSDIIKVNNCYNMRLAEHLVRN
jgi:hypothetical protein